MRKFYFIVSVLYCLLGIIHTSFTPVFYKLNTIDAMWFAGTGLSLLFLGLLNISALRLNNRTIYNLTIAANIISVVFNIALTVMLCEPQAFIGVIFMISVLWGSIYCRIKIK